MSDALKLVIVRDFDAPIEKVWDAWTQDELLKKWSCPDTFTIPVIGGELVVGGHWHLKMESAELGYHAELKGIYKVLDKPHKIVSTHTWVDDDGTEDTTEYSVELSERDGKTHMIFMQTGFGNKESMDSHAGGWGECFNKLDNLL